MSQMKSLPEFLQENKETEIQTITQYIAKYIAENWKAVFEEKYDQLMDAYKKAGDKAYGTYLHLLFLPLNKQLKEAGLQPDTYLPGNLNISREWGNTDDWTNQERWMWSSITTEDGSPVGTVVTKIYHDHTQLRLPRPPQVFALNETGKETIVEALSQRSERFKHAKEFQVEVAEYLKSKEEN